MKILFKNATIVTMNENQVLFNYDCVIENNTISKISKSVNGDFNKVIDCTGKVLMPGLINLFGSSPLSVKRTENTAEFDFISSLKPVKYSDEELYNGAMLSYKEMIKSGITTSFDVHKNYLAVARAMNDSKIRGFIGIGNVDGYERVSDEFLNEKAFQIKNTFSNLSPVIFASNVIDCDENVYETLITFANKNKYLLATNCAKTLTEVGDCTTKTDLTPVQLLESYGFLDGDALLINCVHCDNEDVEILTNYNVSVVACPSYNLINADGVAPLLSFNKKHINLCLGVGEPLENNGLNLFKEMFLAKNLQAGVLHESNTVSSTEVLKMSTINGAKALKLNNLGMVKEGYLADLILLEMGTKHSPSFEGISNAIVNSFTSNKVCLTMVNGKILYKDF